MLLPAGWGFFSNVGGMDSQEDSASAVSPGLLVSLVDVLEYNPDFTLVHVSDVSVTSCTVEKFYSKNSIIGSL